MGVHTPDARRSRGASLSVGACWFLSLYKYECGIGNRLQEHTHAHGAPLLGSMLRSARANPSLRMCILTSMTREQLLRAMTPAAMKVKKMQWLVEEVLIATIPCPEHDPPRSNSSCSACNRAQRFLDSPGRNIPVARREQFKAVRYSRFYKTRMVAHSPFEITAIVDVDFSFCSRAHQAISTVGRELIAAGKALGVRYNGLVKTGHCEKQCALTLHDLEQNLRCLFRCVNTDSRRCVANTGILLAVQPREKSELAMKLTRLAERWYARYVALLDKYGNSTSSPERLFLKSGDQGAFGSVGLRSADALSACADIANIPYNLHLGRHESFQGQEELRGSPIGIHGCKVRDGARCSLYDNCCNRRGECSKLVWAR